MFATRADLPAWVHQARPGALGHDLSGPGYHSGEAERDRPDPHTLRAVQLKVTEEDPPWMPPVPRSVLLPCPRVSRLQPVADLEMVCSGLPRGPPCLHGVTSRSPREPFSGEELLAPSSGPDRPHYPCGTSEPGASDQAPGSQLETDGPTGCLEMGAGVVVVVAVLGAGLQAPVSQTSVEIHSLGLGKGRENTEAKGPLADRPPRLLGG